MRFWGEMSSTATEKLPAILKRLRRSRSDEEAWRMLVRYLWPLVVAVNFRVLRGDRELAEDASQEVFLRIFRYVRFDDFVDKPEDFQSYVRAICRNVSRSYLARLLHEPSYLQEELADEAGRTAGPKSEDAERGIIRRNELSTLLVGLDPEDQKLVLLLQEGASISEVAAALGTTYSNAAVRIHRLRQNLSNSLKKGHILFSNRM
jgi:RNA polymerase sigma factor (sigma-70 family)